MLRSRPLASCLLLLVLFPTLVQAATPGSFRGTVVEGDQGSPKTGWLYVRGKNGSIRRVDISHASIGYDEEMPADQRKPEPRDLLLVGAEVRVTAEPDSEGEWRASRVEIIKPAPAAGAARQSTSGST